MNTTLTRISLFAIKAQRYLPIAMFLLAVLISPLSPEGEGGTGL